MGVILTLAGLLWLASLALVYLGLYYIHNKGQVTTLRETYQSAYEHTVRNQPDIPAIIKETGEALAKSLVGFGQPISPIGNVSSPSGMDTLGLTEDTGTKDPWYPDVEFDTAMGPEPYPTKGGWVQGNGQPPPQQVVVPDEG